MKALHLLVLLTSGKLGQAFPWDCRQHLQLSGMEEEDLFCAWELQWTESSFQSSVLYVLVCSITVFSYSVLPASFQGLPSLSLLPFSPRSPVSTTRPSGNADIAETPYNRADWPWGKRRRKEGNRTEQCFWWHLCELGTALTDHN